MSFSERYGYKEIRKTVQKEEIDSELRTALWNYFYLTFLSGSSKNSIFFQRIWTEYFRKNADEFPRHRHYPSWQHDQTDYNQLTITIKSHILRKVWHEVYEFIQFSAKNLNQIESKNFTTSCNQIFTKHLSAYRFINTQLSEISSEEELKSIETAIEPNSELDKVNEHLEKAIQLMSDRQNPDFSNSIKESISAVEALARRIAQKPNDTLSDAIKEIDKKYSFHPAFKESILKLYGYASDAKGIRHANKLSSSNAEWDEAKFILVWCTCLINFLKGLTTKF